MDEVRTMSIGSVGLSHHELHGKPLTITVATARKLSGLGNTTIWALIKARKLESTKVGQRRLIFYPSFERLLMPEPADTAAEHRGSRPAGSQHKARSMP
jgi:excisionase family DNA binding protein